MSAAPATGSLSSVRDDETAVKQGGQPAGRFEHVRRRRPMGSHREAHGLDAHTLYEVEQGA